MDTFYSDINYLLEEISKTNNLINQDIIVRVKSQLGNMKRYTESTNHYKEKFLFITSFVRYVEKYCLSKHVKIYGSFIRQIFEKIFLDSYDLSGYGDSENHDIDMCVFEHKNDYDTKKSIFTNMINNLNFLSQLDKDLGITFEGYYLIKIQDLTIIEDEDRVVSRYNSMYQHELEKNDITQKYLNIPHYNMIFKKDNKYIIIELFAYPVNSILDETDNSYQMDNDFDVNKLVLTSEGIKSHYNFFSTITSIIKRNAVTNVKLNKLVKDLKEQILTFKEKNRLYNQLLQFIVYRTKILSVGYKSISSEFDLCDIEIELNEKCDLTESLPPYIKINLECKHSLSVMAIAGLTNIQTSEYTQMVSCPFCREKLVPKLKVFEVIKIDMPDNNLIETINFELNNNEDNNEDNSKLNKHTEHIDIPRYQQNEIMSKDNFLQVLQQIGIKTVEDINNEPSVQNDYNNDDYDDYDDYDPDMPSLLYLD
jgi:hypothetical protein